MRVKQGTCIGNPGEWTDQTLFNDNFSSVVESFGTVEAVAVGGDVRDTAETCRTSEQIDLRSLLALANDSSAESRRRLVTVIGDMFAERGSALTERERSLMSDILTKLLWQFEQAVRRDLAQRLADSEAVPRDLLVLLANDEIEVARPILLRSSVLGDAELVEIIHHRTIEHQLAIAMRRSVSARVSAALAETENVDVIRTMLENENAEISAATMAYLVEESRRVDSYQEPLLRREDLDPQLAKRMYWWVSAALRSYIVMHFDVDPSRLDDGIEETVTSLLKRRDEGASARSAAEDSGAARLAEHLARRNMITPDLLVRSLRQGQVALFEGLLGQITRLSPARVRQILLDGTGRALAIACRSTGIDKQTFATLYLLRYQQSDRQVRDPRDLSRALKLFESISPADASQVLRQWRRDPGYVAAIEQIGAG